MLRDLDDAFKSGWTDLVKAKISELQHRVEIDRKIRKVLIGYLSCSMSHQPRGENLTTVANELTKTYNDDLVFSVELKPGQIIVKTLESRTFEYDYIGDNAAKAMEDALKYMAEVMALHVLTQD